MAFYFALFNVSSVNLEENAKKAKYRALKKSTQQRCRSADGRLKTKVQIPTEVSKTLPSSSQNRRVSREDDTGGSLESLPPNDYQYQLSKPRVVEVYNGRKISAPATITQLPRSRLTSITDSVGTATSLANGDIVRKVDDLIYENQGQNLLRRDSAASYKKVTFRYGGDAGRTVTLREERGASAETLEDLPLSSTKRVSSPKRTDSAQNSSFSSRFLGRLSSHTSPKIKRNATWHITHNNNNHNHNNNHNYNNNNNINRRPSSISPLNKLRAIIKKLMAENRRKKILNNLKQAAVLYHQQEQQTEKVAEQKKKEQQQQQKEQQQQQQLIKSRPSSIHPLMLVDLDNNSILSSPPPIDHIALVTLQNLQNQTMEDSYKDSGRSTINSNTNPTTTTTAPVHLRSRFGRSWSRREERPVNSQKTTEEQQYHWSADVTNKKTMTEEPQHHWPGVHNKQPTTEEQQHHWSDVKKKQPTTNDQHHWPTTLTLRRTPSMICSSKANNNVEVKLKRRSAAVMETSHLRNSKENVSSSNSNSGNKTNQLNQSQINRPQKANRQRVQPSKEKEQKQQQQQQQEQQNNKKPVVRRKSTTDKTTNSTTFKPLGTWSMTKSKKRSYSSNSQQSNDMDEELHKLLPLFDENRNPYYLDEQRYDIICDRQFYGWLPINGYVNPLFVSLSAPNSPAHVRIREKRKTKPSNLCINNNQTIDQRFSLIETRTIYAKRNGAMFPKPKTSWWNRTE